MYLVKEELVKFRMRVQEFFEGFFNICTAFFHSLAYISAAKE